MTKQQQESLEKCGLFLVEPENLKGHDGYEPKLYYPNRQGQMESGFKLLLESSLMKNF